MKWHHKNSERTSGFRKPLLVNLARKSKESQRARGATGLERDCRSQLRSLLRSFKSTPAVSLSVKFTLIDCLRRFETSRPWSSIELPNIMLPLRSLAGSLQRFPTTSSSLLRLGLATLAQATSFRVILCLSKTNWIVHDNCRMRGQIRCFTYHWSTSQPTAKLPLCLRSAGPLVSRLVIHACKDPKPCP